MGETKRKRKLRTSKPLNEPKRAQTKENWLLDESDAESIEDQYFGDKKIEPVDGVEQDMEDRQPDAKETFKLPENEQEAHDLDPEFLRRRIDEVLSVLANFREYQSSQKQKGVKLSEITSRSSFLQQLKADCATYYGYLPSLIELFFDLFSPNEAVELLESNDRPRPVVIRVNTLKTRRKQLAQKLISRGVNLKPLENFGDVGLTILESAVPIGATPEYLSGHYMLQAPSSFCPVLALDPQPDERILDMASAPGGKSSFIAQLMRNTGCLIANDFNSKRIKATVANLTRLGVSNTIHTNLDGREFPKVMSGFDKILLDAPCSGLGVICRDPSIKLQRDKKDIYKNSVLQKQLLLSAIDALKVSGTVVYSTCSLSIEENEKVVQYALNNRGVMLEDTKLSVGKSGLTKYQKTQFHPSMKLCKRFYPHVHNTDGFFVARLKKISKTQKQQVQVAFSRKMTTKQKKKRDKLTENALRAQESSG